LVVYDLTWHGDNGIPLDDPIPDEIIAVFTAQHLHRLLALLQMQKDIKAQVQALGKLEMSGHEILVHGIGQGDTDLADDADEDDGISIGCTYLAPKEITDLIKQFFKL
jgi:hypothetical protein